MSLLKKTTQSYKGVKTSFFLYWKAYGGFKSLFTSPYLHFSIIFSVICWIGMRKFNTKLAWYDLCLSILPDILGFTLGGYALLIAFGDEKFRSILSGPKAEEKYSPFFIVNATFLHFIFFQLIALLFGIWCKTWIIKDGAVAWLGFTIFVYALVLAISAAFAILRVAKWYDQFTGTSD